jgi:anti-sigma regulatory factor (Ser/Thr protein kinase)
MSIIRVPSTLNMSNALRFRRELSRLEAEGDYVFDFGQVGHTDPFGLLLVADTISRFKSEQLVYDCTSRNHERLTYQSVMGFFRACGFDHGYAPGEAPGGSNYLPITNLSIAGLRQEAREQSIAVESVIEDHAHRMAEVLTCQADGDLCTALTYALREVIRNVLDHSRSDQVHFCAQHWPTRRRVHLAILDRGRGVRASLSANPHLTIDSDLDALKLCLMPGVSGRMHAGVRRRTHDIWQNSGYGLYMTSRLATSGGNFWILSGRNAFGITSNRVREIGILLFEGTALRVSFDTRELDNVERRLRRFSNEGHEMARQFAGADPRGASAASTLIRTRF